jgi:hypothetical protein
VASPTPLYDAWDPQDDSAGGATPLLVGPSPGQTAFHGHDVGYGADAADYFSVTLTAGHTYDFSAIKDSGGGSISLEIRTASQALVGTVASDPVTATKTSFDPASSAGSGIYFLVVRSNGGVSYHLSFQDVSGSQTPSPTPLATSMASPTETAAANPSGSATPQLTDSSSATASSTATPSPSQTPSPTSSETLLSTLSATMSASATPSLTSALTATASFTPAPTATLTATVPPTSTPSGTSSQTPPDSATSTSTQTLSPSGTLSATATPTLSWSATPASSWTSTLSPSSSSTQSQSASPSPSAGASRTPTLSETGTLSPTESRTASPSPSSTASSTPSASRTLTLTETLTLSPTESRTPSPSLSSTSSPTPSASATPTGTATVTPSPTPIVLSTWRINSGGPAYTDSQGHVWSPDTGYSGGTVAGTGSAISGTADPVLYQDERWGAYSYTFNVPPGSYQVTLKFAETFWTSAGKRVFNVSINGSTVLSNFDIFADAGGEDIADDKIFNSIAPLGGQIVVTLGPASKDNATLDAIQIIPQPATPTASPSPSATPSPTPTAAPTAPCTASSTLGATTSFVSYEAEAGTPGGGATIVALTTPPTTEYSSPALEASGHAYVHLNGDGQYVQWTNNTGQNITAINLRSSIPDAPAGGGISSTIDLYVNGAFRQAFSVNSQQNYCYEGLNYGDQTNKNPSAGIPRDFWNDTHAFVSGAPIAPGDSFAFQMDAANSAAFYDVDVVDVENPPPALAQPANSLSIASYGAVAGDSSIDNTAAINACFSAAQAQGKMAWIPSGIFYISAVNGGLTASSITISGAGPWYSTLYRVTPANNTQGIANIITTDSCTIENLALDCNASSRAGNNNNGAVNSSGSNWLVDNVWIQHVTSSFWCAGNNGTAQNCRTLSTWADGGNFNNVQDPRGIGTNLSYINNFVRGTGDDAMAINSVNYNGSTTYTMMSNITYKNNTAVAPWGGKGIGIYGGSNIIVTNNLLSDTARFIGLGVMKFGVNGSDLLSATVMGNSVLRCGGNGYNQQQQAMMIGNGGDGQGVGTIENAYIGGNTITDALFDAVGFSTGYNNVLQNNVINAPGLDGIAFGSRTIDLGTCSGDALLLNNTVNSLPAGRTSTAAQGGFPVYAPVMAASYNSESGATPESCVEGGQDVGSIKNASYTEYDSVDLTGAVTFVARVASAGAGGSIQVRADSPSGALLGTCIVPVTGCWQTWTDVYCSVSGATGLHSLYLVYSGGGGNLFNIQWFSLTAQAEIPN